MTSLYITSMGVAGGKTTLCAGLGQSLSSRGKRVGYLKPVTVLPEEAKGAVGDKDAEFMKQALALEEPLETLCPVTDVKAAYAQVSQGKDVVLIEGAGDFSEGSDSAKAAVQIVQMLAARAILVARYSVELEAEQIVAAARLLADHLLGVVLNAVPQRRMDWVKASVVPQIERHGIKVLGVLPEDRMLFTFNIAELAEHLGGNILNNPERRDELVENLMVGSLTVDSALTYLSTKANKAVITRGDRPDIQLAALDTSTRCLVLTDNIQPIPMILNHAQEQKIPIITVKNSTIATMEAIEGIFGKSRFHQEGKLGRLEEILQKHLDLEAVYRVI